jgi:hypothetical protein
MLTRLGEVTRGATRRGRVGFRQLRLIRQDFLLELFFSRQLPGQAPAVLVERQITACQTVAEELAARAEAEATDSFDALVCESRLAMARATIAWLKAERDHVG